MRYCVHQLLMARYCVCSCAFDHCVFSDSLQVDAGLIPMLVLGVGLEVDEVNTSKRPNIKLLVVPVEGQCDTVWLINGAKGLLDLKVRQARTSFSILLYL